MIIGWGRAFTTTVVYFLTCSVKEDKANNSLMEDDTIEQRCRRFTHNALFPFYMHFDIIANTSLRIKANRAAFVSCYCWGKVLITYSTIQFTHHTSW